MTKPKVEPILRQNLLRLADAFIAGRKASGGRKIGVSTLSRLAHNDPWFFDRLSRGEIGFTARKYDEVVEWFKTNWPEGVAWPAIFEDWPAPKASRKKR